MELIMVQSNVIPDPVLAVIIGFGCNILIEVFKNYNAINRPQTTDRKELLSFFVKWNISSILGFIFICGLFTGVVQSLMLSSWIQNKSVWLIKNIIAWIFGVLIIVGCHVSGFWVGSVVGVFIGLVQIIPIRQHLYDGVSLIHVINTSVAWTIGVFLLQYMNFRSGLIEYIIATIIAGAAIGIITFYPAFFLFAECSSNTTP
jgi:hypothetical protein